MDLQKYLDNPEQFVLDARAEAGYAAGPDALSAAEVGVQVSGFFDLIKLLAGGLTLTSLVEVVKLALPLIVKDQATVDKFLRLIDIFLPILTK